MKWLLVLGRVSRAWVALLVLHWYLKRKGFHGVFPWYIKRHQRRYEGPLRGDWPDLASQWLWAIDIACRLVPWEARCLHRSFLGFRFLRERVGLPVEMVIGVQKFPFSAHAWLVLGPECINEDPQFVSRFTVILRSKGQQAS